MPMNLGRGLALLAGLAVPRPGGPLLVELGGDLGLPGPGGDYGASVADLDGDARLDLLLWNHGLPPTILFGEPEGSLREVSSDEIGIPARPNDYPQHADRHGGSCADLDADGDVDLFVAHGALRGETLGLKRDELLLGDGRGCFVDATLERGLAGTHSRSRVGAWGDLDRDGRLDLIVASFESPLLAHLQQPDGTFLDHTTALGLEGVEGARASFADYDLDGVLDLATSWPLRLFRGSPEGGFIEVAEVARATAGFVPFDLAWGDIDGDCRPDLGFVSRPKGEVVVVRNRASGLAVERVELAVEEGELGLGLALADLDLDGDLDLVAATSRQIAVLANDGRGRFVELERHPLEEDPGRTIAVADLDADGAPDVVVNGNTGPSVWGNATASRHWLTISPRSRDGRNAWGARIVATLADGRRVCRQWLGHGGGSHSLGCGPVAIGLGDRGGSAVTIPIEIEWPSGARSRLSARPASATVVEPP